MNNKESNVQIYKLQPDETNMKAVTELPAISTNVSVPTVQEVGIPEVESKDMTMNFFIIGGVINISMILAYFVWAFIQWKKIDKRNKVRGINPSEAD